MRIGSGKKRIVCLALTAVLTLNTGGIVSLARPEWPADVGILAEAGIAVDADTGAVLFGQNIHQAYAPASITKLLTALVVAEQAQPDETVTFSHDAVYDVESGSGNALSLEEGDVLTVRDCLYALLLRSSNQAANALAEHVAGSRDAFVEMMNRRIAELGCAESHFANPSGLNSDEQYVTAYDMAVIARAAFRNPTVLEVASARRYAFPATINNPDGLTIAMEHRLLRTTDPSSAYYLEGAVAGKTGYTSEAGNTLVTYAVRGGRGVLSVILKGKQPQYYQDGKALIEFGFSAFEDVPVYGKETFLEEQKSLETGGAVYPAEELYLSETDCVTLPAGAEFADAERSFEAEVPAGSPGLAVGLLRYTYDGRQVGTAYIYARSLRVKVEEGAAGSLVETETGSPAAAAEVRSAPENWPLALGVILALALLALLVFWIWYERRKSRRELARRRARQRQRLRELGYSQQEFDRMLEQRRRERKDRDRGAS